MDALGGRSAAGQQAGIAQGGELRIEKIRATAGIGHAAADQQLGHHRRDSRGVLQGRDAGGIVRVDAPALRHGDSGCG